MLLGVKNICVLRIVMRYIVLDTNCLLQALPSRSPYHKIWSDVLDGKISLCVSTDILEEYEEKIAEKSSADIAHNVVEAIAHLSSTYFMDSYYHFGLLTEDEDDNKFVDCAIACDAELIVTNDKHFNALKNIPWPKVETMRIEVFAEMIAND